MQKFVLLYTSGDGCTWSSDNVVPVACESEEALLVLLDDAVAEFVKNGRPYNDCMWSGVDLNHLISGLSKDEYLRLKQQGCSDLITHDGYFWMKDLPEIVTLEDWFSREAKIVEVTPSKKP